MQITLRSQMIAGTAAVVGASAIALTPMAPAANLPALNVSNAGVGLAAFANPLSALVDVGLLLGNYTLNGVNGTAAENWPDSGIGAFINGLLPALGVTRPGLLPNVITNPFPILTQLATNVAGYAYTGVEAVGSAFGDLSDIAWLIPATAVQVAIDLTMLDFDGAVTAITDAFAAATSAAASAIDGLITATSTIVASVIDRATAVFETLADGIPTIADVVTGQVGYLVTTVTNVVENVITGLQTSGIEGGWNALVGGLLDPAGDGTPLSSLPGSVINLTYGAGVQADAADPTSFVPSVRTALTTLATEVADDLQDPSSEAVAAEAPAAAAAVAEEAPAAAVSAADVKAAAAEAEEAPAAAVSAAEVKAEAATGGAAAEEAVAGEAVAEESAAAEAPAAPAAEAAEAKADPAPKRVTRGAVKRGAAA